MGQLDEAARENKAARCFEVEKGMDQDRWFQTE